MAFPPSSVLPPVFHENYAIKLIFHLFHIFCRTKHSYKHGVKLCHWKIIVGDELRIYRAQYKALIISESCSIGYGACVSRRGWISQLISSEREKFCVATSAMDLEIALDQHFRIGFETISFLCR